MFGSLLFPQRPFDHEAELGAPGTPAKPPAPIVPPTVAGLAQLDFLVGGVWVTTHGASTIGERVQWDAAHTFLLTEVTTLTGDVVVGLARGSFGYAPQQQCLMSNAVSTSGTYTGGYSTACGADTWVFAMMVGCGAAVQSVRVTMEHPSADELVFTQAVEQDGEWVAQPPVTYQRRAWLVPADS